MTKRLGLFFLTALLSVSATQCRAEEKADKDEAAIIAKEDEEEAKLEGESDSPLKNYSARGKFLLLPETDERKTGDVIGEFRTATTTFLVKPMHEATRKILADQNGKEVTLLGKLRGNGKYFIVEDASGGGAKPVEKRNPRKL